VDYRKLNAKTISDTYPLPHIDELIDSIGGCRYFSTMDAARSGDSWSNQLDLQASNFEADVQTMM